VKYNNLSDFPVHPEEKPGENIPAMSYVFNMMYDLQESSEKGGKNRANPEKRGNESGRADFWRRMSFRIP
jgi:hypothetical protein